MGKKLTSQIVKKEFYKEIKKFKKNWELQKIVHQKYQIKDNKLKFGRTWMIYFKCENNHDGELSLSNLRKGTGCGECLGIGLDIEKKIEILEGIHQGVYTYENFRKKGNDQNFDEIPIKCSIHGIFYESYSYHKEGKKCEKCFPPKNKSKTGDELIKLINQYSNGFLSATNIIKEKIYKSTDTYKVRCNVHEWHQESKKSLKKISRKKITCDFCDKSQYELIAYHTLHQVGLNFEIEKFIKYKDGTHGFIDIVISDKNGKKTFIEIDGEQHSSKSNNFWGGDKKKKLNKIKSNDLKKDRYAKSKNIPLFRIDYKNNIKSKIIEIINNGNFKLNKVINKKFPVSKIKDGEEKALKVHQLYIDGVKPKEIKKIMNILGSQVSKIIHGYRYKSLFLTLYPKNINTNYKGKKIKHLKLNVKEKEYLIKLLKEGSNLYPKIKKLFEEQFKKTIPLSKIKNIAIKEKIKSPFWKNLNEDHIKIMKKMRANGNSYKNIVDFFTNNLKIKISRPTIKKKIEKN